MAKKTKRNEEYNEISRFIKILIAIGLLTVFLIGYLFYIELTGKHAYLEHDYNKRWGHNILRGEILSEEGTPLAWSEWESEIYQEPKYCREIDHFAQIIHANCAGVEMDFDSELRGKEEYFTHGRNKTGETVHLTISEKLQNKAAEVFEQKRPGNLGAVVAIEPATGKILCAYSHPKQGEELFRNVAMEAGKEPGSTMKAFWAAVSLEENLELTNFNAKGSYAGVHNSVTPPDTVNVEQALKYSVNKYFAYLADQKLGIDLMRSYAERAYIGKPLKIDGYAPKINAKFGVEAARMGIGQGGLSVSPLHMAMICSVIANDGVLMKPHMVSASVRYNGITTYEQEPEVLDTLFSKETANRVTDGMIAVVNESGGTGQSARISGITVAGKTGTAEGAGANDAWFIGFAPADDPQIAVAVYVEDAGSGGASAAPIAGEIMRFWLTEKE